MPYQIMYSSQATEPMTVTDLEKILADARAERSWEGDRRGAEGAVRLNPDEPVRSARELGLSNHGMIIVYCA